jgi:hypothetical protein
MGPSTLASAPGVPAQIAPTLDEDADVIAHARSSIPLRAALPPCRHSKDNLADDEFLAFVGVLRTPNTAAVTRRDKHTPGRRDPVPLRIHALTRCLYRSASLRTHSASIFRGTECGWSYSRGMLEFTWLPATEQQPLDLA